MKVKISEPSIEFEVIEGKTMEELKEIARQRNMQQPRKVEEKEGE